MRVENSKETYVNRDYKYKVVRLRLTTLELRSPGVVLSYALLYRQDSAILSEKVSEKVSYINN